jgi:hypothetical protein
MKPSRSRTLILVAGTAGLVALALVYQARPRPAPPLTPTAHTSAPLAAAAPEPAPTLDAERAPGPTRPGPPSGLPPPRFLPPSQPPEPAPPSQSAPPPTPPARSASAVPRLDPSRSAGEQARAIYDALGIPPEQRTQVKQVLDIQRDRFQEIREQLMAGQIDQRGFGNALRELRAETEANLVTILGAEGVKAWRGYQREVGKSLGPSLEKMVAP